LLDAGLAGTGQVIILEPRRLAARAAARRMSAERGTPLGDVVGYHVRFDRQAGPRTRLLTVTPGILLRRLHDDPFLESTSIVLFDEFHERSLENDLALGMCRLLQQTVRPDLKLLVMSATIETDVVTGYLGACPVVASEGHTFPVEIVYEPRHGMVQWEAAVTRAVGVLLSRTAGDLLVFLPGMAEIRRCARELESLADRHNLALLTLHGDLPPEQQDAALLPMDRRKVVLATNVAETSVTVEGVTGVVDTGLARILTFDPSVGLDRLEVTPISRASADQRAGRAGRTQPGVCIRLWSEAAHRGRAAQTDPEVRRVDLAGAVLHLLSLGEDIRSFPWLESPPEAIVAQALDLLGRLQAVDDGGVTALGQALARLPVHPRLGRLLIEGQRGGDAERTALAAALLAERDPFLRTPGPPPAFRRRGPTTSDVLDRVESVEAFEGSGRTDTPFGEIHRGAARFILRARDQLLRSLRQETTSPSPPLRGSEEETDRALRRALFAAFPDRLARRRNPGGRRGVMVGGRGVRLADSSGVTESELFVCIDIDVGQTESVVRLASAVQRDWLPAERVISTIDVTFDQAAERVTARKRVRFDDLILEESAAALPEDEQVAHVLAAAAGEQWERVRPADDSAAGAWLTRVRCLSEWMPDLGLPQFDDAAMKELLPWLCTGRRSFADLRSADWLGLLLGRLTHSQRQAVEREAPERLAVPSGSQITLTYEVGRPPVLAVRIQELFGLAETPRVAASRIPVLLHLLAPNFRPQQVTDDLASFWANTYPQVRKDMRARYPKHPWPDDPLAALPQRRPQRKRPAE
jgi:ATP-dependent helicase HrpB